MILFLRIATEAYHKLKVGVFSLYS